MAYYGSRAHTLSAWTMSIRPWLTLLICSFSTCGDGLACIRFEKILKIGTGGFGTGRRPVPERLPYVGTVGPNLVPTRGGRRAGRVSFIPR